MKISIFSEYILQAKGAVTIPNVTSSTNGGKLNAY